MKVMPENKGLYLRYESNLAMCAIQHTLMVHGAHASWGEALHRNGLLLQEEQGLLQKKESISLLRNVTSQQCTDTAYCAWRTSALMLSSEMDENDPHKMAARANIQVGTASLAFHKKPPSMSTYVHLSQMSMLP